MNEYPDGPWEKDIPYGPLTEDYFNRLATSFSYPNTESIQAAAIARGIKPGDYLKVGLQIIQANEEKKRRAQEESPDD